MVKCPIVKQEKLASIYALTRKFNVNLENTLADQRYTHILKVSVTPDGSNFDMWGRLNAAGKCEFWGNIDEQFRDFDRNKTDLRPEKTPTMFMSGARKNEY